MISDRVHRIFEQMPIHRERHPVDWDQPLLGHYHASSELPPDSLPKSERRVIMQRWITPEEVMERYGAGV